MNREDMVLLQSASEDRETRAAIVDGRLFVGDFDRYRGEWIRDPECGVSLSPDGIEALRRLLAQPVPCTFEGCKNNGQFDGRCYFHRDTKVHP